MFEQSNRRQQREQSFSIRLCFLSLLLFSFASLRLCVIHFFDMRSLRGGIGCAKVDRAVLNDNGMSSRAVQRFLPTFRE
jgi:hypothetical protein